MLNHQCAVPAPGRASENGSALQWRRLAQLSRTANFICLPCLVAMLFFAYRACSRNPFCDVLTATELSDPSGLNFSITDTACKTFVADELMRVYVFHIKKVLAVEVESTGRFTFCLRSDL
jgi:hypothetical protein